VFGFLFHDSRGEEFVLCNVKNGMEGTWRDNKWTAPAPAPASFSRSRGMFLK